MKNLKVEKKWIALLLGAVLLFSLVMVVRQELRYRQIEADIAEAQRLAGLAGDAERAGAPSGSYGTEGADLTRPDGTLPLEALPPEAAALTGIDLEALRAVNGDVVGWIAIPGTELSYPLLQTSDNQYYLNHNWKREPSSGGAVYLEATSDAGLGAFHTLAYGHRMRNGTMFASLKYYNRTDYLEAHPSVYIVLDNGVYRYDIFSAREADVKGIVYRLDLEKSGLEGEFLDDCLENSVIDAGFIPMKENRFLTLSTCTGIGHATRWVAHGVLSGRYCAYGA